MLSSIFLRVRFQRVCLQLGFCLVAVSAQADISHYDLKGVDDLLSESYPHLSPIHGFTLLGTKTLENMRFYGNYNSEKKGYGCLDPKSQIGQLLRQQNDCPQDSISELIQRLFPSQDGVNFVPNQIGSDIASHLDSETLGKIVGRFSLIHGESLSLEEEKKLESDLTDILFESLNPRKFLNKKLTENQDLLKIVKAKCKELY